MRRFSPGDTALEEAANWLARLCADDRTADDESAFRAWLIADPRNAIAFDAVNTAWESVGALPRDLRDGKIHSETGMHRRALVMGGLGFLVALGGSVAFLNRAEAEIYQTDIGQQKRIVLHDGTNVLLDTDTRLTVTFTNRLRAIELDYGRANFSVAPDAKRAFSVKAADDLVTGDRSDFDVRCEGDSVSVLLLRGQVSVQNSDTSAGRIRVLDDGERLTMSGATTKIDRPNLASLIAWQTGQAVFDNCALAAAISEMNRYSNTKLEIDDPRIANMKVSGVYRVGDNAGFARALSHLLPVEARIGDDRIALTADEVRLIEG